MLGSLNFSSPLILAPMSSISTPSFRFLMQELGAGGSISELISAHGINYKNKKTLHMMKIHPKEKYVGLQIFGEDETSMAQAAKTAESFQPQFIDINMGCPVRKVVSKGGGSALLKDTKKLSIFFKTIKSSITIPLSIKIRTGWDEKSKNAHEVIHIAKEEGIEFVAIHGRTRTQQYTGSSNWEYLESLANSSIDIVGNGDLHSSQNVKEKLHKTQLKALMIARGALRNPFIFLEPFIKNEDSMGFTPSDYLEVILAFEKINQLYCYNERNHHVQLKKHASWFAYGFNGASRFRGEVFKTQNIRELIEIATSYFLSLESKGEMTKTLNYNESFMAGGHG